MHKHWTLHLVAGLSLCAALAACGAAPAAVPAPAATPAAQAAQPPLKPTQATQPTQPPLASTQAPASDAEQIQALVTAALKADKAPAGQTIDIQHLAAGYARVAVEGGGGTSYYFMRQQSSAWSIAGTLYGPVNNLDYLRAQGFPELMLSDLEVAPAASTNATEEAAPSNAPAGTHEGASAPILDAVYAYLNLQPSDFGAQPEIENVQGPYARVSANPPGSDGLWLFVQQSQGGWFVVSALGKSGQPDLSEARAKGVPEELLTDIEAD